MSKSESPILLIGMNVLRIKAIEEGLGYRVPSPVYTALNFTKAKDSISNGKYGVIYLEIEDFETGEEQGLMNLITAQDAKVILKGSSTRVERAKSMYPGIHDYVTTQSKLDEEFDDIFEVITNNVPPSDE
ncbi:MAG: hypothetical protein O2779_01865 [Nanoarchaeota archaeon]|nr:hypothetical protein [Nanoarchaeota archaeon]